MLCCYINLLYSLELNSSYSDTCSLIPHDHLALQVYSHILTNLFVGVGGDVFQLQCNKKNFFLTQFPVPELCNACIFINTLLAELKLGTQNSQVIFVAIEPFTIHQISLVQIEAWQLFFAIFILKNLDFLDKTKKIGIGGTRRI